MLATEIPVREPGPSVPLTMQTCAGRVRDVYYEKGYAPRIALVDPAHQSTTIFQTEKWDAGSKTWTTNVTASSGEHGHFVIAADTKRMYAGALAWMCAALRSRVLRVGAWSLSSA